MNAGLLGVGFTATGAKLQVTSVVPAQAKDTVPPNPLVTLTVPVTDEVAPRASVRVFWLSESL